jgi:hypothetical protein
VPKPELRTAAKSAALLAICSLAPPAAEGACAWCGTELPPRRRTWCSDTCGDAFWANHWWSIARSSAKRRDKYTCVRCGERAPKRPSRATQKSEAAYKKAMTVWRAAKRTQRLEVNHIEAAMGRHGQLSCAHHLENLETLCPDCHKEFTAAQRLLRQAQHDRGAVTP